MTGSYTLFMQTSWPAKLYFGAMAFALITLVVFTPALDPYNGFRLAAQVASLGMFALRYAIARRRQERSRVWVVYVVCMFAAAPIWIFALEPFAWWVASVIGIR